MKIRLSLVLLLALIQAVAAASAQGFMSVSSLPAPSAATAGTAPGTTPDETRSTAEQASDVPAVTTPAVPAATTLAFSSISSINDARSGAGTAGSGPSVGVSGLQVADRILVEKGARRLYLLNRGQVIAEYPIKLGLSPRGHKQFQGDFRTPEGVYHLSRRNPRSEFFLSVEVSYPNATDRARAKSEGLPPGGLIMIHGQPNVPRRPPEYYANNDWTDGCIAVTNAAMVDIWQRTRLGIPIEIRP